MYSLQYIITQGIHNSSSDIDREFIELFEWAVGDSDNASGNIYEEWDKRHKPPLYEERHLNDKIQNTFANCIAFVIQAYCRKNQLCGYDSSDVFNMWLWSFGRANKDLMPEKMKELWKEAHPDLPELVIPDTDLKFLENCIFATACVAHQVVKHWKEHQRKKEVKGDDV